MSILIDRELMQEIFEAARNLHPREIIFLLRGKKKGNDIVVSQLVMPPIATYGKGFANFPFHMLPIDFSIVGTVHSHPSGELQPSPADLNHLFGVILMIVSFPYNAERNIGVYDYKGKKLTLQVTETR